MSLHLRPSYSYRSQSLFVLGKIHPESVPNSLYFPIVLRHIFRIHEREKVIDTILPV